MLANPGVVLTISEDGGTQHSTSVTESTPQTAIIKRNRAEISIMEETTTNSSMFVRCIQIKGLLSGVNDVIRNHGNQVRRKLTTDQCRDGLSVAKNGATIPNSQL